MKKSDIFIYFNLNTINQILSNIITTKKIFIINVFRNVVNVYASL
jgi:hypothetical protein